MSRETCWARREKVTETVTVREKVSGVTETEGKTEICGDRERARGETKRRTGTIS